MAEWLCSGLQSRLRRFDSGFSLHIKRSIITLFTVCPGGGIGRHKGLKIPRQQWRAGSSPAPGTITSIYYLASKFVKVGIMLIEH